MGKTGQVKIEDKVRNRKGRWLGHTLINHNALNQTGAVLEPTG
jgi:hypothetical protein